MNDPVITVLATLLVCTLFGAITANLASGKNRSIGGWWLLGFFFGFLALVAIACLPPLKADSPNKG